MAIRQTGSRVQRLTGTEIRQITFPVSVILLTQVEDAPIFAGTGTGIFVVQTPALTPCCFVCPHKQEIGQQDRPVDPHSEVVLSSAVDYINRWGRISYM